MLKISFIASSTTSKLLRDVFDEEKVKEKGVDNRRDDEKENSPTFSASRRSIGAIYLICSSQKTFKLLLNMFI